MSNTRKQIEEEEKEINSRLDPYSRLFFRILKKMYFNPFKSLLYYKNIPAVVFGIFFNPVMALMYISYSIVIALLYFSRH